MPGIISTDAVDVEQFARDGFAVVRSVFDPTEVAALRDEAERLIAACTAAPPPDDECELQWDSDWMEDEEDAADQRTLRMIFPVVHLSEPFLKLAFDPRITEPIAQVLGDDSVSLFEDKLNCKLPGGSGFAWHQDWSCCWRLHTDQLVSCFVALDAADARNGALQVIPGSHAQRECLPFKPGQSSDFEVDPAHVDARRVVTAEMEPGDILLFDCFLLHHSERNRSDRARRTVIYSYGPARLGRIYEFDEMLAKRGARLGAGAVPVFAP